MKLSSLFLVAVFLFVGVPAFADEEISIDDLDLIQQRIENRKNVARGNTIIGNVDQLDTRAIRARRKGAFVVALDADQKGNIGLFMKANKSTKQNRAEFFGPFFFAPEGSFETATDGSTAISLVDDQGDDIKLAARDGVPIFIVGGVEQSLRGPQGPQGLTGAPGAPGANGISGAIVTAANISSNSVGDPATDDFVFGSTQLLNQVGTADDKRMLFDKSLGAFRVGEASGTQWDAPGLRSVAFGSDNIASNTNSFAGGQLSTASGAHAIAFGSFATASGFGSAAFGQSPTAGGSSSMAVGSSTTTSTAESFACCLSSSVSGGIAVLGYFVNATGSRSITIGEGISGGTRLVNSTPSSLMVGFKSDVPTLFVGPGDGTASSVGNVGIGTSIPARHLHITDTMRLQPRSAAPSSPALGDLYVDSDSSTLCFYDGATFVAAAGAGPCT